MKISNWNPIGRPVNTALWPAGAVTTGPGPGGDGTPPALPPGTSIDGVVISGTPGVGDEIIATSSTAAHWTAPPPPSFATPAIVLGTAAAAGAATTAIRSDSTIVAFDATVSTTQAFGDAADAGSGAIAARRNHKHGMMASPLGLPLALTGATAATRFVGGTTSGAPVSGTFAIGDFVVDRSGLIWICTAAGSPGTWTAGTAASTITTQDEGGALSSTVTTLNFVGAGVTASGAGATTTVTIPGVSSGDAGGVTATDDAQLTCSASTDLLTYTHTFATGLYLVLADLYVNTTATGAVSLNVDGSRLGNSRDARTAVGLLVLNEYWTSDGSSHTFTIGFGWESGTAVFGLAGDARWGRCLKVIGPLGKP